MCMWRKIQLSIFVGGWWQMRVVGPTYTFSIQRLDNISGVGKYIVLKFSARIHMEEASIPLHPSPMEYSNTGWYRPKCLEVYLVFVIQERRQNDLKMGQFSRGIFQGKRKEGERKHVENNE